MAIKLQFMKQTLITFFAALVALISCSCAKQELAPSFSEEVYSVFTAAIEPGLKTSLDGTSVKWSAGDAVSVSSSGGSTQKFTLVSGAGTTSARFSGTMTSTSNPFFVIYPYGSANSKGNNRLHFSVPQNQTYVENSFASGSFPMYGSFNSFSDPVDLKNVFGGIKLQFTGECTVSKITLEDLGGKMLWGNVHLVLNNGAWDLQKVEIDGGSNAVNLICPDGVTLDKTTPTAFYFSVPAGSFSSGLKATVYSGSTAVGSFTTTADKTISRNNIRVLASKEVTGTGGGPTDLSLLESANCYILYDGGQYKFKAVKGNGSESLTVTGVEVLWETVNTATAPSVGTIIKKPSFEDGYITFTATGIPGNALIAAKNGSTIVWSWHIWVPSTKVTKAAYSNGKVAAVMDRNVGALVTTAGDPLSNGLLYQWGRKDPFMGSASYSSTNTPIASTTTFPEEPMSTSTDIDYVNARPTTFILQGSGNDWLATGSKNNWDSSTKTIYDPCPPGYRVAPNTTWDNITNTSYANNCWTVEGIHNYPLTGQITGNGKGRAGHSNSGYIWNGLSGTNQGQMLYLTATAFTPKKTANRSWAHAVRCCSDTAPAKAEDERKLFDALPAGTKVSSISAGTGSYSVNFSNAYSYPLSTSKAGLVTVSDEGKWVVNGVASSYDFVATSYRTVGADGMWYLNGVRQSERATPENTAAGEGDIYVSNVIEKARTVRVNFSDGSFREYEKQQDWGMYVEKTAKELIIYMGLNSSNDWIAYKFYYRNKAYTAGAYPCNYDNWGLGVPYKVTRSGSVFTKGMDLFLNGEAEAAVQVYDANGAKTYVGGTLHGWELISKDGSDNRLFSIKIDGVAVGESSVIALRTASSVNIEQTSNICIAYSDPATNTPFADIVKTWTIGQGTVAIGVKYTMRSAIEYFQAMFGMFCVKRRVDKGSGSYITRLAWKDTTPNIVYSVEDGWETNPMSNKDKSATRVEEYGDAGLSFAMSLVSGEVKSKGGFKVGTNGNNYNKIYFDICGNYSAAAGEVLSSTVKWEIDYISDYDKF